MQYLRIFLIELKCRTKSRGLRIKSRAKLKLAGVEERWMKVNPVGNRKQNYFQGFPGFVLLYVFILGRPFSPTFATRIYTHIYILYKPSVGLFNNFCLTHSSPTHGRAKNSPVGFFFPYSLSFFFLYFELKENCTLHVCLCVFFF